MSRPPLPKDGRARRRVESMRRIQDAALGLFEERGYSVVTINEIAEAAGVGPATVYRSFGAKERIVLWDEYDPMLLEAVAERLGCQSVCEAVKEALIVCLERVYETDKVRILRRARLILAEPELIAEASKDNEKLAAALAQLFTSEGASKNEFDAKVGAAAVVATLAAAIRHWTEKEGKKSIKDALVSAFDALARLG